MSSDVLQQIVFGYESSFVVLPRNSLLVLLLCNLNLGLSTWLFDVFQAEKGEISGLAILCTIIGALSILSLLCGGKYSLSISVL